MATNHFPKVIIEQKMNHICKNYLPITLLASSDIIHPMIKTIDLAKKIGYRCLELSWKLLSVSYPEVSWALDHSIGSIQLSGHSG